MRNKTLHDLIDDNFTWNDLQALLQMVRNNWKASEIEGVYEGLYTRQQILDKVDQLYDIGAIRLPRA